MSIRMMIIDGQAEFRSLLMHHITTHWPDAILSAYDPIEAGHLPDEFSGASNGLGAVMHLKFTVNVIGVSPDCADG